MMVLALPPRLSLSSHVSREFLYGMYAASFLPADSERSAGMGQIDRAFKIFAYYKLEKRGDLFVDFNVFKIVF